MVIYRRVCRFTCECRSRKASWQPHYQNNSHRCPFASHTFASPRRHPLLHHRQNTGGGACGEPQPANIVLECPARLLRFAFVFTPFAANVRDGCRLSESELRRRFRLFCVMYSQPQAAAPATIATFRTICFSWERFSRLVITPRPQPYRPIRPKRRPRNTVAPRGRNGAVDPGDPCHEPRVGLNCSSIDGFRVA
jgi:hypothetical protein